MKIFWVQDTVESLDELENGCCTAVHWHVGVISLLSHFSFANTYVFFHGLCDG